MTELRELTTAAGDYHAKVDERLANLPAEITEGVSVDKLVKDVSEAFRQQLVSVGLKDTTAALQKSCSDVNSLSYQISAQLAPLGENYTKITSTIATELDKLTLAYRNMQAVNAQLVREQPGSSWVWTSMALVVMFLMGGLCGVVFEKNTTGDVIRGMNAQLERLQMPFAPAIPKPFQKKMRKQNGD